MFIWLFFVIRGDCMFNLMKASSKDCDKLLEIQAMAFTYLLDKYNDVEMNPANESVDKIKDRIKQAQTAYYLDRKSVV